MSIRREYNDLLGLRAQHLAAAEAALNSGSRTEYDSAMGKARELDPKLEDMKALMEEQDRYAVANAPRFTGDPRDMAEMGKELAAKRPVRFDVGEVMRGIGAPQRDATTVATGSIVTPTGAGSDIRDGFAGQVSSLVSQVYTANLKGLSGVEEPYVVEDMEAQGSVVATASGTARTDSDPTFAKAAIKPYGVDVTTFVDRNLANLSPADYAAKIQTMAMRALRRKINALIVTGDGQGSPSMYGITTAKNTEGSPIFGSVSLGSAIGVDSLEKLVYAYGGDEEVGGNARLLLTKANLQALGAIRGTNEKRRLYRIIPDVGNPNTGVIEDGGLIVPYTIVSALGDTTMSYGDPINYELGLFGDYVIRVDESVKAVERLNAILGDVMVGGNLVVDKGFVNGTIGG